MNPTERAAALRKKREREAEKYRKRIWKHGSRELKTLSQYTEIDAFAGSALLEEKLLEAVRVVEMLPCESSSDMCVRCRFLAVFDSWLEGKK